MKTIGIQNRLLIEKFRKLQKILIFIQEILHKITIFLKKGLYKLKKVCYDSINKI